VTFLALSPSAAWALLAGVALVILLLHLLRPPAPKLVVPSVLLWALIAPERKRPNARRLLLLLLALGAGLCLALALTRPEAPTIVPRVQHLALILDNSPSMAARMRDGRTRWEHAVEQARALLRHAGTSSEVMLMDTTGQFRVSGFVDRDSAIAALARVPPAGSGWDNSWMSSMPPASRAQLHVFTDGVAQTPVPDSAIVHAVFEPADNVAVTAFVARPHTQDPTRYEALVQVLNASPGDQRVRLLVTGNPDWLVPAAIRAYSIAVAPPSSLKNFLNKILIVCPFCPYRQGEKGSSNQPEPCTRSRRSPYLRAVWTLVKVAFSFEPRPATTVMMATEMPAAMRPYSMAVAPESSCTKRLTRFVMFGSLGSTRGCLSVVPAPVSPGRSRTMAHVMGYPLQRG
jgi:hypothetical protein